MPVHHVRLGEAALGDQPDVFGDIGVGRTGPLAIDYFVEIIGRTNVGGFHPTPLAAALSWSNGPGFRTMTTVMRPFREYYA